MQDGIKSRELVSPFNIIFSCVICQRTIADVYPNATLSSDQEEGRLDVPCKMWITECTHLTCSEHLDGGGRSILLDYPGPVDKGNTNQDTGVPFHPHDQYPSAPCPLSLQEKGDTQSRRLFAIFAPRPGDHDPRLPSEWFKTPPMKLDDKTALMSALR